MQSRRLVARLLAFPIVASMLTGGPFAGARQPRGCKYCNDDAALSGHWPELFGLSTLAINLGHVCRRSKWEKFPKNFKNFKNLRAQPSNSVCN